jgi:hypothetical protein
MSAQIGKADHICRIVYSNTRSIETLWIFWEVHLTSLIQKVNQMRQDFIPALPIRRDIAY